MQYLSRIVDQRLKLLLNVFGAVLVEGPKWCGKTTTAEMQSHSILRLQDPDERETLLKTAEVKPSLLLDGETPRLLDEWQDAPVLWDAVRIAVDKRKQPGQFILTGSTSIDKTQILHSGTGRITRMKMYPMSLYESLESTGEVSLKKLFDDPGYDIDGKRSKMTVEDLIFAACRGGWPTSLSIPDDQAKLLIAQDYLNAICQNDISTVDNVQRDPALTRLILRSYARNISTLAKKSGMIQDILAHTETLARNTFDEYITALEKLFVIEDINAWSPSIRSSSAIKNSPKHEFCDPSVAVAALGLNPKALYTDLKTFGYIFESMCVRDLKVYCQDFGSSISYYHDRYGLEADIVLHLADGRYALIECKLGSREIEVGAEHLLKLKKLIQEYNKTEKQVPLKEPDLLIILTGGNMAYTRKDGVKIIPLACLKD